MNQDWEITNVKKDKFNEIMVLLEKINQKIEKIETNQEKFKNNVNFKFNDLQLNIKKNNKSNIHYDNVINLLEKNKELLKIETNNVEKLKDVIDNVKKNNNLITNNLSNVMFQKRHENALWRSLSNNYNKNYSSLLSNILF